MGVYPLELAATLENKVVRFYSLENKVNNIKVCVE
jgi:hypothetical protein